MASNCWYVLLHDAVSWLSPEARAAYTQGDLSDLVYADDTLLISVLDKHLSEYLRAVTAAGRDYGMQLHWGKFQLLPVNGTCRLQKPDGEEVPNKTEIEYLGTCLAADGTSGKKLTRRMGTAKATFLSLVRLWKHSNLTRHRKMQIYISLVESRLLYGLPALCLNVAEKRRLDGFQNRCIRQVIGVKPSYISRVSNHDVLQQARHVAASRILEKKQLQLLGKIVRAPEQHPLRAVSFIPGTLWSATDLYVRRRGRPKKEWIPTIMDKALRIFHSYDRVAQVARDVVAWKAALNEHYRFNGLA